MLLAVSAKRSTASSTCPGSRESGRVSSAIRSWRMSSRSTSSVLLGVGAMPASERGEDLLGRADVDIDAGLDIEQRDRAVIDDHGIALAA